jgi:hypothetical protein
MVDMWNGGFIDFQQPPEKISRSACWKCKKQRGRHFQISKATPPATLASISVEIRSVDREMRWR